MPDKKRLTLSRRETNTLVASWCRKDFIEMCDRHRAARAHMSDPMDKCYWCKHPFENGEKMSVACFKGKGNKVLCRTCADELLKGATDES